MSKKKRENITIYGSLIAAIVCLIAGGLDYYHDLSNAPSVKEEVKEAIHEELIKNNHSNPTPTQMKNTDIENEELQQTNKNEVVKKYLNSINNQVQKDNIITYDIIRTWGNYDVINMTYQKQISNDYYLYITDIKIPNLTAKLPINKNEELSTNEYLVISIKTYLLKTNNGYILKNFEI